MNFIFLGKECFLYKLISHDDKADIAILDIYKNIQEFKSNKSLKSVEISDWSYNF